MSKRYTVEHSLVQTHVVDNHLKPESEDSGCCTDNWVIASYQRSIFSNSKTFKDSDAEIERKATYLCNILNAQEERTLSPMAIPTGNQRIQRLLDIGKELSDMTHHRDNLFNEYTAMVKELLEEHGSKFLYKDKIYIISQGAKLLGAGGNIFWLRTDETITVVKEDV